MRCAFDLGVARTGDGVRHLAHSIRGRGLVEFAGQAQRRHAERWQLRQRIDIGHGVPSLRPAIDVVGEETRASGCILAGGAELRREPAIERCFEHRFDTASAGIVTACPRDGAGLLGQGRTACGNDQSGKIGRIGEGERLRDHAAEGESGNCSGDENYAAEQRMQVGGVVVERMCRRMAGAPAVSPLIDAEHRELLAERRSNGRQKSQIEPDRVQQHDFGPATDDFIVKAFRHRLLRTTTSEHKEARK